MLAIVSHWRAAVVAGLGISLTLGAYAAAMSALGLPLLPSSVLLKSDIAEKALAGSLGFLPLLSGMLHKSVGSFENREAWPVIILICLVAAHPLLRMFRDPMLRGPYRMSPRREALLAAVIAGTLGAHVLFGSWGWFGRYESYAVATGAMGAVIIWRRAVSTLVSGGSSTLIAASIAILFYVGNVYVISTLRTPLASLGIFEQQYQMHRFAVDFYKQAVAVNDLGWVSYRNPNYVLDLAGVGSEAARRAITATPRDPGWVDQLVTARNVGLAMIYDSWFAGEIPAHWQHIAVLRAAHLVTASSNLVSFYATSRESVGYALYALRAFGHSTGAGTQLTILCDEELSCPPAAVPRTSVARPALFLSVGSYSPPSHHDQEMIAHRTQQRPVRNVPVDPP
jgi:hypothetical protein